MSRNPVTERYEAEGFEYISTGGGCDAFSLADPQWMPPQKLINLPAASAWEARRTGICVQGASGRIDVSLSQLRALVERANSILENVTPPYILVTDDAQIPEALTDQITVGYYDAEGEQQWYAELPDSETLFRAIAVWKTSNLSLVEVFAQVAQVTIDIVTQ